MTRFFEIEGRRIGQGCPVFIIAEIGVNHNGDISIAKKIVDAALKAGADAVKFQTFKAEDICTEQASQAEYQTKNIGKLESQQQMLKRLELTEENHMILKQYCDEKGIIFCSTPHSSTKDVDFLEKIGVPLYKTGSGDLTNLSFLDYIARKGKPMIVSTGMATESEIVEAYEVIKKTGNDRVIFLKCTTNYPCPDQYANVRGIVNLGKILPVLVGYSDHTLGYAASALAVSLGAIVIEKHFTLDKNMEGPDHKASLELQELKEFISILRAVEQDKVFPEKVFSYVKNRFGFNLGFDYKIVLGHGELMPYSFEEEFAKAVRKSIVAAKDLPGGKVLEESDLTTKRPGTGLLPRYMFGAYNKVVGKKLLSSLRKDQPLSFDLLKENDGKQKRKILYFSGTRAEYGLMRNTLQKISEHPDLDLTVLATGMHLMPEFGRTVELIRKDGFTLHEVDACYREDTKESMSLFLGEFIQKATPLVTKIKPDIILVLGDRAEMLSAAIIGTYLSIPVAHLHGGEVTSTVDEHARHAITKLAHLHLPATKKSAERINNLGEEDWRIQVVGAPGLDNIIHAPKLSKEELEKNLNIDLSKPTALVLQHPVTTEVEFAAVQMQETLEAVREAGLQVVVVYPNADAGGRKMIEVIEKYRTNSSFSIHANLERDAFIGLMQYVGVMVGNSSSGIIEATSFGLPVVNVGSRQEGRERAANVIDATSRKEQIKAALAKALSQSFKDSIKNCANPYGDGKTADKIVQILSSLEIHKNLLQKKLRY